MAIISHGSKIPSELLNLLEEGLILLDRQGQVRFANKQVLKLCAGDTDKLAEKLSKMGEASSRLKLGGRRLAVNFVETLAGDRWYVLREEDRGEREGQQPLFAAPAAGESAPAEESAAGEAAPGRVVYRGESLESLRQAWERELIREVLRQTGGNKTEAARRLQISIRNLYNKIERLKVIP